MSEAEHGDEPLVSDPAKANKTEQTGGWGTGTQGGSTVAGVDEVEGSKESMAEDVAPDEKPPDYDPHPLEGRQTEAVDEAQDAGREKTSLRDTISGSNLPDRLRGRPVSRGPGGAEETP